MVEKAKKALREIKDHKIALRLQAIIIAGRYKLREVGEILGVSSHSIRLWAIRFREGGIEGLRDKKKGHRRRNLGEMEKEEINLWLREGIDARGRKVHWTKDKLREGFRSEESKDPSLDVNQAYGI